MTGSNKAVSSNALEGGGVLDVEKLQGYSMSNNGKRIREKLEKP